MTGRIHSVQSLGAVDGPGIRFVVFMQGCNLRCPFCHNPSLVTEECQAPITLLELGEFLKARRGILEGVCVSGGEPLMLGDTMIGALGVSGASAEEDSKLAAKSQGLAEYLRICFMT